ncbi:hypothetical protein [Mycobacterium botniense]|uniref:hypothetical protein n=1 Tax=Mycobacterium botniense TaxID=84962 RepID=UPI0013D13DAF|nr:hypothetical protein [Mycobacterium botniense]
MNAAHGVGGWSLASGRHPLLGLSTWEEFGELPLRLERAVVDGEPMTDLDWARVLF